MLEPTVISDGWVNSAEAGIVADGTDQRAKIEAWLASGPKQFRFNWSDTPIRISGNVNIPAGVTIEGGSFLQTNLGAQTFDIRKGADRVTIRGIRVVSSYSRSFVNSSYRGDNSFSQSCAVWCGANYCTIEDIEVRDSITGVWFMCWDHNANANVPGVKGNSLRHLRGFNVDFGVLFKGQYCLAMDNLYCEDVVLSPGSPNPGHTIYGTGAADVRNTNVTISNVNTVRANTQYAVQVKFTDNLSMTNLTSDDAASLCLTDCHRFGISNVTGTNVDSFSGLGGIYIFSQNDIATQLCEDGFLTNVSLSMKPAQARALVVQGIRLRVDANIMMNRPANSSDFDVHVGGNDNDVRIQLENNGAGRGRSVFIRSNAWYPGGKSQRNRIEFSGESGSELFVIDSANTEDTRLVYDPSRINFPSGGQVFVNHAGTRTRVERSPSEFLATLSGGGTPSLSFSGPRHTRAVLTVNDNAAYTINAPEASGATGTPVGVDLEIVVVNNTAAQLGSMTWNALYQFRNGFIAPDAGKAVSYSFRWNGLAWIEVEQSLAQRSFESFGAVGNGATNDTAAIHASLAYSVATGQRVFGTPGKTYAVAPSTTRTFTNGNGTPLANRSVALVIPNGAKVDFAGCPIVTLATTDHVIVCNDDPDSVVDVVEIENLKVNCGGGTSRGIPAVWFYGLRNSRINGLEVYNGYFQACLISGCEDTTLDRLVGYDVVGNCFNLGGNTAHQLKRCRIGSVETWRVQSLGSFNQPGNGIVVGAEDLQFDRFYSRNCAGGIKFTSNCTDIAGRLCRFDGRVLSGETDFGTANSGTKIQADNGEWAENISIDNVFSTRCKGAGLFIENARDIQIGKYQGKLNGLLTGTASIDADVQIGQTINDIQIGCIISDRGGSAGVWVQAQNASNTGRYQFGDVSIINCGQNVEAGNKIGFKIQGGRGSIQSLRALDTQSPSTMAKGIEALSGLPLATYCKIQHANVSAANPNDIRTANIVIDDLRLSGTPEANVMEYAPTTGSTSGTITNGNVRRYAATGGWFAPLITVIPINAAARALAARALLSGTNGQFTMNHSAAQGTEVYRLVIGPWSFQTTDPS